MNISYQNLIQQELSRLKSLGWQDFDEGKYGVRTVLSIDSSHVAFPSEAWNPNLGNTVVEGPWAVHRSNLILDTLKRLKINFLLEVGSGDGNVAIPLYREGFGIIAIEPLESGAIVTSKEGLRTYLGTLSSMKFPENSIEAIGLFDVIEHLENPDELLQEVFRVLKPGGWLLITVPAHDWLFSDFDESIGHFRRYSRKLLCSNLMHNRFTNIKINFFFSIFVVPALFLRKLPTIMGRKQDSKAGMGSFRKQNRILNHFSPMVKMRNDSKDVDELCPM